MSIEQKFCLKNSSGEDIYLFTLINKQGSVVNLTNYGAIITGFKIKSYNGQLNDIVLGFDEVSDYLSDSYLSNYAYLGAACGRYSNRIKNARFVIDSNEYHLSANMGHEQLHGGITGFDKKVWEVVSIEQDPFPSVSFKYFSVDGEEGYPGNLETTIRFTFNDDNELCYEFTSMTDKPTAVNLTHHSYFNLNNGEGSIEEHEVKIYASHYLMQDENLVCNGELIPVAETQYDFRIFKKINRDWNKEHGYDQCFIIDNKSDELSLVAEARSAQSALTLKIYSTEPAVQFYTGQGLNIMHAKNDIDYKPYSGFCLETHKHPNAINIPHFPNTVLRPGEKYYQKNVYKILQNDPK